jgi:hypothetical protein
MGTGTKVTSTCLRVVELICAAIVVGILGRFQNLVDQAGGPDDARIVYSLTIGCISLFVSLVLLVPFGLTFYFFAVDFVLFVCWMVAFGLMENVSVVVALVGYLELKLEILQLVISGSCSSFWYQNYWGYYWGQLGYTVAVTQGPPVVIVRTSGCGEWRANLAFSFIGSWLWLISGFLVSGARKFCMGGRDGAERE